MNDKILKKFKMEMRLNACLKSIKETCEVAASYLNGSYEIYDLNELTHSLSCATDYIKEVEEIVDEIIEDYEEEIRGLNDEQL